MTNTVSKTSSQRASIHLFLDFDGTLTNKDTLHFVAQAGYDLQKHKNRSPPPTPWSDIVGAYTADYKAHTELYTPPKAQRCTVQQEIEWLRSLQEVEEASAQRVFAAGVFDDLTFLEIVNAADNALRNEKFRMRKGWRDLLSYVDDHNQAPGAYQGFPALKVLSVNWSASFVERVMTLGSITAHAKHEDDEGNANSAPLPAWTSTFHVYANEIRSVRPPPISGVNAVPMRTSGDKLQQFNTCCSQLGGATTCTMYIGDSTTDFECLLAADVGICIRDEPMESGQQDIADTCKRVGIEVSHIDHKTRLNQSSGMLWWARDFMEIKNWLEAVVEK